jgi:hypothetical protein
MPNPIPQIGDIWCFKGLGLDFYYLVVKETECDPDYFHADSVTLLSFTKDEKQYILEGVSKMTADSKRWKYIS